jgi:hypothetical protein
MMWREPKNNSNDCCFWCCNVNGYSLNLPSALCTVVHGPEVLVLHPTEILEDASTNSTDSGGDDEFQCQTESRSP